MILWRLSGAQHARAFDGGYGLMFDGRWNTVGHAVTYAGTSPSLCVLEKLVHIEDPALMPDLVMVRYDVPDDLARHVIALSDLPTDWTKAETLSQGLVIAGTRRWKHRCWRCPPPSCRLRDRLMSTLSSITGIRRPRA